MSEQATAEEVKNKGGRPKGSTNKPPEYVMVEWMYTQNQWREEFDVEKDTVVRVQVDPSERKKYKEKVRKELIAGGNWFDWELKRNERLAKQNKPNRIRIVNWYAIKDTDDTTGAIESEDEGIKTALAEAGV